MNEIATKMQIEIVFPLSVFSYQDSSPLQFQIENRATFFTNVQTYLFSTCDRPGLRYLPGLIFWVGKQVSATGQASATCDRLGLRYLLGFIFWVGKQVPATGQVSGTCRASYFGWGNRYLQPATSQVPAGLHILGGKTSTCDRPGLRYMPGFIFWVGKKIPVTGQVLGICRASYSAKSQINGIRRALYFG